MSFCCSNERVFKYHIRFMCYCFHVPFSNWTVFSFLYVYTESKFVMHKRVESCPHRLIWCILLFFRFSVSVAELCAVKFMKSFINSHQYIKSRLFRFILERFVCRCFSVVSVFFFFIDCTSILFKFITTWNNRCDAMRSSNMNVK